MKFEETKDVDGPEKIAKVGEFPIVLSEEKSGIKTGTRALWYVDN